MIKDRKDYRPSVKSIKTAISVFLCLLIYYLLGKIGANYVDIKVPYLRMIYFLLHRSYPIYACISAIISMQSSFKDSWGIGRMRIEGTAIGGIIGLAFLYIDFWLYNRKFTILIITIGTIIVIWSCEAISKNQAIKFAYITFLIIMLTSQKYNEPAYLFAINRTIDTAIGVLVSLVVNLTFDKINLWKQEATPMVDIRIAQHKDLKDMLFLYTHLNDYQMPKIDYRVKTIWDEIVVDKNRYTLVAVKDDHVVSSLTLFINHSLAKNQRPFALIEYVVTHPDYRHKGIATELLTEAQRISEKQNCYKMMLITGQKNEKVHKLYKNFGFKAEGKTAYVKELEER